MGTVCPRMWCRIKAKNRLARNTPKSNVAGPTNANSASINYKKVEKNIPASKNQIGNLAHFEARHDQCFIQDLHVGEYSGVGKK